MLSVLPGLKVKTEQTKEPFSFPVFIEYMHLIYIFASRKREALDGLCHPFLFFKVSGLPRAALSGTKAYRPTLEKERVGESLQRNGITPDAETPDHQPFSLHS